MAIVWSRNGGTAPVDQVVLCDIDEVRPPPSPIHLISTSIPNLTLPTGHSQNPSYTCPPDLFKSNRAHRRRLQISRRQSIHMRHHNQRHLPHRARRVHHPDALLPAAARRARRGRHISTTSAPGSTSLVFGAEGDDSVHDDARGSLRARRRRGATLRHPCLGGSRFRGAGIIMRM